MPEKKRQLSISPYTSLLKWIFDYSYSKILHVVMFLIPSCMHQWLDLDGCCAPSPSEQVPAACLKHSAYGHDIGKFQKPSSIIKISIHIFIFSKANELNNSTTETFQKAHEESAFDQYARKSRRPRHSRSGIHPSMYATYAQIEYSSKPVA